MRPAVFDFQCSARSKRSGRRCKNYACRERETCRMHGGTSISGSDHPNFKHGRHMKLLDKVRRLLQPRPIKVTVFLFPRPLHEITPKTRRQPLRGSTIPLERLTIGEWMRALRAARRTLAEQLAELRAEVADRHEYGAGDAE